MGNSLLHALGVRADGAGVDQVLINYPEFTSDTLSSRRNAQHACNYSDTECTQ